MAEVPSPYPNTRLISGNFVADILVNRENDPPVYHWVVQRIGSADVVAWGQESSFEEAQRFAQECMVERAAREQERNSREKEKASSS